MVRFSLRGKISGLSYGVALLVLILFARSAAAVEPYLSAGFNFHSVSYDTRDESFDSTSPQDSSPHISLGIFNRYGSSQRHYFGFGVEAHQLLGDNVLALRALNYQYQLHDRWRIGSFFGALELDYGASQTGYYLGTELTYLDIFDDFDVIFGLRVSDKLQRDTLFDDDPVDSTGRRPDFFTRFAALTVLLNWRF